MHARPRVGSVRRLYFETGHSHARSMTDRMTGSGRQRQFADLAYG
jgi:hypothetical protein